MDNSNLDNIRHSLAHLLAAAVLKKYPDTKLGIGPVIDNGFYYDFLFSKPISDEDLKDFEKDMKKMIGANLPFSGKEISEKEAKTMFEKQPFKLELIEDFSKDSLKLTAYSTGDIFTDLCRGGHIEKTAEISPDSFKLDKIAGAYWRGSEKNPQLTRIYGLAFAEKAELDAYIKMRIEAEKRDHRVLGKQLKLFTVSELVGAGLPLIQPRGMVIRKSIEDYLWDLHKDKGYLRVWTPHLAKEDLYVASGHAAKFGDELFRVQGKEEKFFMKPMNCPHHMQIFADNQFSYRDMPIRYFEPATVYRDEKSGQLGGLTRVRSITQDDGHLFCRVSQIKEEVKTISGIIKEFYATMGMLEEYWVSLSVRGENKSKYLGSDENWIAAETALEEAAKVNGLPYRRIEGEAAFYGPKLDFMFKDAIGRQWQLATIQCDFNLPERFDLAFTNEKGEKERPVVIHRAISGSLERFMGVLIEHFGGAFPVWLAPVQAAILPVGEKFQAYADALAEDMRKIGIRVMMSDANETLGKRIREAKMEKFPYVLVVGEKEESTRTVSVQHYARGQEGEMKKEEFLSKIEKEIAEKSLG